MLVGLLSDTHDHADMAKRAVDLLRENGAEYLIHAGDLGGQAVIDTLTGGPAGFVWGNNDFDCEVLQEYARDLAVVCFGALGEVKLGGKQFAVTHGDNALLVKRILREQRHDYLITGHTHVAHDRWQGKCRWINPGALYRAAIKTVALLDTEKNTLRTLRVV